jgi:hypothetical protein
MEASVAAKPVGKVRKPLIVIILCIVTFGIYSIIYLFKTFSELRAWRG